MRRLLRFKWDFARMGTIEGLFIASHEQMEAAWNAQIDLGEVLGKHSAPVAVQPVAGQAVAVGYAGWSPLDIAMAIVAALIVLAVLVAIWMAT